MHTNRISGEAFNACKFNHDSLVTIQDRTVIQQFLPSGYIHPIVSNLRALGVSVVRFNAVVLGHNGGLT